MPGHAVSLFIRPQMNTPAGNDRSTRNDRQLRLADGRMLGYSEYGDPHGRPVVFLHGFPGSRLAGSVLDEAARAGAVRVLALERPGLGLSAPQPGRTLLDHARDVRVLGEQLGVGRLTVLGESGGGPYALACAHELPDCVDRVAVVCGLGPRASHSATVGIAINERIGYAFASRMPGLAGRALAPIAALARRHPHQFQRLVRWQLGAADRRILQGPLGDLVAADFAEAFRQGGRGVAEDLGLLFRPWPFELNAIRVPVIFFHGQQDRTVPVAVAHSLAARVPGSQLRISQEHGHFSLLTHEAHNVLTELARHSYGSSAH
jgi:pimeloyl-ACP methyl ester carboxylesterase